MLGRTVCLSFLTRNDEAIGSATEMIDRPTHNVSDAFYWRAWNHRFLKSLALARADIESAKAIAATGMIFTLAGMIEHDQDDLSVAEEDLLVARRMSGGSRNCAAAWYLGLVHMKQERFEASSTVFEAAMDCYQANVAESEAGLREMEARTDVDPDFKARQIAGFEAALLEDRSQYFAAAFNTANQSAQAGDKGRALRFLAIAARGTDPALQKLVVQLRELLKGPS
jgi:tetratricopeptide (TPR) repeat protein